MAKVEETTRQSVRRRSRKQATPRKIPIEESRNETNEEQSSRQLQIVNDAPAIIDLDQWEEENDTVEQQTMTDNKRENTTDNNRAGDETGEDKSPELRRSKRARKATVKYGEAVRIFNIGKIH